MWIIKGGGFCTATALNFLSAHAHTLSVANKTFTEQGLDKKKVVYFSLEYKRAPEASIEEIVNESLRAHNWLRKKVGVTHLVLASDSAGSNVTLQMLSLLSTPERDSLKGSIWFSPFLDLSLSFPSHDIVTEYGLTFDVLTRPIVTACANHALFGHDDHPHVHDNHDLKKHPDKSPFYQCTKTLLVPPSPTLVIYSKVEMFGPVIKDWVDRIQRISGTVVEQVIEENMPHDFALIGSLAPIGDIGRTSWRTGERVASVLVKWMTDDA